MRAPTTKPRNAKGGDDMITMPLALGTNAPWPAAVSLTVKKAQSNHRQVTIVPANPPHSSGPRQPVGLRWVSTLRSH
jgi:hypothetical protein